MNLIVLEPGDFVAADHARLVDRRLVHARKHLRAAVGDRLRVGLLDEGLREADESPELSPAPSIDHGGALDEAGGSLAPSIGHGEVLRIDSEALELRVHLFERPPPATALTLALALPRPHTLAKVLQQATALGVKRVLLFHSRRVEKSYWDATALAPAQLRRQLILGLEQCVDTVLPRVELHRRFRPFAEDRLAALRGRAPVFVADPEARERCPRAFSGPACLVLGPEGGFVDFERELLASLGARLVGLGPRILRVETAAVALLARLAPDRGPA